MGYIQSSLIAGEQVLYTGRISLWALANVFTAAAACWAAAFASAILGQGTLLLLCCGIGIGLLCYVLLLYQTIELAVTNKRVISKRGVISRSTTEIGFDKVESVEVQQSISGRFFDYGTIFISGTGTHTAEIPNVSKPMVFRHAFMSALDVFDGEREAAHSGGGRQRQQGRLGREGSLDAGGQGQRRGWFR